MKQQKLVIVRGLPGSGKSTFAKRLLKEKDVDAHFEADDFFLINGVYRYNRSFISEAHRTCQEKTKLALSMGLSVVVANTFTTAKEIDPYRAIAKTFDVVFRVENMATYEAIKHPDYIRLCYQRNIHNVPFNTIKRMAERYERIEDANNTPS